MKILMIISVIPGIIIAFILLLGSVFEYLDYIKTPRHLRFLFVSPPFPPLTDEGSQRLAHMKELAQTQMPDSRSEQIAEEYLSVVEEALRVGDRSSLLKVFSCRRLLRRRARTSGQL